MLLNLREVINVPGAAAGFEYELDISDFEFESVKSMSKTLAVKGTVKNSADVLMLTATVKGEMVCVCARCLAEIEKRIDLNVQAVLADELQDENNPDIFLLDGDYIDVDEVIITAFVLDMEQKFLCREDCKGLCEKCGKNLNDGPCDCKTEIDPRWAALQQLLEKE